MRYIDHYLQLTNDRKDIVQQIALKYCTDSETFRKLYQYCLSDTAKTYIDFAIEELFKEQKNEALRK